MRKFRVTKVHRGGFAYDAGMNEVGKVMTLEEINKIYLFTGNVEKWNNDWAPKIEEIIEPRIEEIIEPRIELKCIGFEEGQPFRVHDSKGYYTISDNTVWWHKNNKAMPNPTNVHREMLKIGKIKILKEPTEKEKLEQRQEELREKIDKENLADVIEYLENESKLKELE